ncbi:AAA family ATPase [Streptosporangium sp. NBC_01639]|uniref:AAA family ATPase n=1 Tax=unclassified Streptosporangium TaxID=2632669 RepID=UPI002DDA3D11|nr:AAA family ATPase [Streptosporangium sp. NBC_01756]WSC88852.1 AAA family ATPase [Streptosporangium sp. NBC_01756]WTD52459.1 AAA family ATPase [Streptosporangium sp. NBC_01639]
MITRIEIDGFKSFLNFGLDVPPFLALVGPNSSGKSNLFDAVTFVADEIAGSGGLLDARRGLPGEQFHRVARGAPIPGFVVSVEALVSPEPGALLPIRFDVGAEMVLRIPRSSGPVVSHAVQPLPEELLELIVEDPEPEITPRRTVQSWRRYVPSPAAMRRRCSPADRGPLAADGANLAAVLGRMAGSAALVDLRVDLAGVLPDVVELLPRVDREECSFELVVDGQGKVPAALLSDGTLRTLGLLAALHDPDHPGTLLVEEIENSVHPGSLGELIRRIRQRVVEPGGVKPFRQVILTSHSPVVVAEIYQTDPDALTFLDTAVRVDPDNDRVSRVTVAKPILPDGEPGTFVSPRQVRKYLGAAA